MRSFGLRLHVGDADDFSFSSTKLPTAGSAYSHPHAVRFGLRKYENMPSFEPRCLRNMSPAPCLEGVSDLSADEVNPR